MAKKGKDKTTEGGDKEAAATKKGRKAIPSGDRSGVEFFLRFYGATVEQINACLGELQPYMKGVDRVRIEPLKQSCNPLVPTESNTEVIFVFKSMAACDEFKATEATRTIYMKYASPKVKSELVVRNQGDTAFRA